VLAAIACVGAVLTAGSRFPQTHTEERTPVSEADQTSPVIRVSSELVVLHVADTDKSHRAVSNHPCSAFVVYESNRPQEISICEPGGDPLTLGLVMDSSTSMARYGDLLAAAGEAFVRLGNPENDVFVLQFNEHVTSMLRKGSFTHDPAEVAAAVRQMSRRGMTAFHDAVLSAIDWTTRSDRLMKAVVLVSDGGDNASSATFEDALRQALEGNVTFFAIDM
jgi:Ca-activated chloride channel family protein